MLSQHNDHTGLSQKHGKHSTAVSWKSQGGMLSVEILQLRLHNGYPQSHDLVSSRMQMLNLDFQIHW